MAHTIFMVYSRVNDAAVQVIVVARTGGFNKMRYRKIATMVGQLTIILALSGCTAPVFAEKTTCPDSAQQYWTKFRTSVLLNNVSGVADVTQFPFVLSSGTLDTDRTNQSIARSEFLKIYPQLLKHDPGLSLEPSTMRDLIKASERLTTSFCSEDGGQFRVGDWVFQKVTQNWRFIQAYVEEKADDAKEETHDHR